MCDGLKVKPEVDCWMGLIIEVWREKNSLGAKLSQAVAFGVISIDFWLLDICMLTKGNHLIQD